MPMLFSRTASVPVWLLAFGMFVWFESAMTFAPGVVLLLVGSVALTIMLGLGLQPSSTIAAMTVRGLQGHEVDHRQEAKRELRRPTNSTAA